MNIYLAFAIATVPAVVIFAFIVFKFFSKSFVRGILLWFIVFTIAVILTSLAIAGEGPTGFFWGCPVYVVLSSLFIFAVSRSIRQIRQSIQVASGLASGGGDLTRRLDARGNDEIATLNGHLNRFLDSLSDLVAGIRAEVSEVRQGGHQVDEALEKVTAAAEAIAQFASRVNADIEHQVASVSEVAATVTQMVRTIGVQDAKIQTQAVAVAEGSSAIEEMMASIRSISVNLQKGANEFQTLNDAVGTGRLSVTKLQGTVGALATQSDKVLEANTIIKNLASNTNLLAMNAAIEAAHAGESGRGFAVVANEIRSLAERSNQQSKIIAENLKALKVVIEGAVASVKETEEAFGIVFTSVDRVSTSERLIQDAISEQASGSSQIVGALAEIRKVTQEVHDGSSEILAGSRTIEEEASRLKAITADVHSTSTEVLALAHGVSEAVVVSRKALEVNRARVASVEQKVGAFEL